MQLLGSTIVGFLAAFLCALSLKILKPKNLIQEVSFTITMPWICYLLAESLHLSGIVAILFCGIGMSRYTLPNLTKQGAIVTN